MNVPEILLLISNILLIIIYIIINYKINKKDEEIKTLNKKMLSSIDENTQQQDEIKALTEKINELNSKINTLKKEKEPKKVKTVKASKKEVK